MARKSQSVLSVALQKRPNRSIISTRVYRNFFAEKFPSETAPFVKYKLNHIDLSWTLKHERKHKILDTHVTAGVMRKICAKTIGGTVLERVTTRSRKSQSILGMELQKRQHDLQTKTLTALFRFRF